MIKGKGSDRLSNLGELGVLGANPIRGGEETRAKGAKGAKVKGMNPLIDDLSLYSPTKARTAGTMGRSG